MKEVKSIVTHDGPFHADDVFAVAVLKNLYPKAKVIRSRDASVALKADVVLDVGGNFDINIGRYDHHQEGGAGKRDNGIELSAIGLIWQQYGLTFCDGNEEVAKKIEESLVAPLDANDNGQNLFELNEFKVAPTTLPDIIRLYRPSASENQDFDVNFNMAVDWAKFILDRMKIRHLDTYKSKQEFRKKLEDAPDKRYLILDEYMVGGDVFDDFPDLLFTIFPSTNGQWTIRTVSKDNEKFFARKNLPAAWGGLETKSLVELTGVEDAVFCHRNLWICGAKSKDGILKLLKMALAD